MRITPPLLTLLCLALTACGPLTFTVGITPNAQRMTLSPVMRDGQMGSDRVAIIDVSGLLVNADAPGILDSRENPVATFQEALALAAADDRVRAVVLRMNTPGGAVTATDIMYRELLRFRRDTGKPVVTLMMDVTASGGYYLACGSDAIVAYPSTVTGSIGVIVQTVSVRDGLQRIGIHTDAIVSRPNKDIASPLATLSDEERAILQNIVDDMYDQFRTVVREGRPGIDDDQWERLTDGRIMTGRAAADAGLVDSVGDLRDALALAQKLAGIERADVVLLHRPLNYVASPYGTSPPGTHQPSAAGTQINLMQLNLDGVPGGAAFSMPMGFYYLWQP